MNYNELSKSIYKNNVAAGWWDGDVCIYEKMQLISTEIAEATEGERKNLMDDKLPHRKMAEVELADTLIRTLDLGGRLNLEHRCNLDAHPYINKNNSIGKQYLALNIALVGLWRVFEDWGSNYTNKYLIDTSYEWLINSIVKCAEINGYDIESAMSEKLEFNKTRADHKPENRALKNGKKF